ncbi:MAG: ABC transporter substrate-binding protein [Planctomycetes bacterium]|nr:ABC transporter substrate-binding protein [Planctomycetota bacterium]
MRSPADTASPAPRVASLLPAATEIVCALGAGATLVGISHACEVPPELAGLPRLTRSRLRAPASGDAVAREAESLLAEALAPYEVDVAALRAVAPELILTQDLCAVCAVAREQVEAAAHAALGARARVLSLQPRRLAEVLAGIREVAALLHAEPAARSLLEILDARIQRVRGRTIRLTPRRVLVLEWLEPLLAGGLWTPELIELAGGRPVAGTPGGHAPALGPDDLARLDPEVVVVVPCGFSLAQARAEWLRVRARILAQPWAALRSGAVHIVDGNAYFNRPGPRLVDSLEILACCVHPAAFPDLAERRAAGFARAPLGPG